MGALIVLQSNVLIDKDRIAIRVHQDKTRRPAAGLVSLAHKLDARSF